MTRPTQGYCWLAGQGWQVFINRVPVWSVAERERERQQFAPSCVEKVAVMESVLVLCSAATSGSCCCCFLSEWDKDKASSDLLIRKAG